MRVLIFLLMVVSGLMAFSASLSAADPPSHTRGGLQVAADLIRGGPQSIMPSQRKPKIGDQQAAAKVRETHANQKILAVQLIESQGPPVYRVKTLSEDGVVKYVFVDGVSGDVFE